MSTLPDGAIWLATANQGRAFEFGDQLVIDCSFNGKRIETRLPVGDLDWLWRWADLFRDACDTLAQHQLR
jgi:hypothetical protein